MAPSSGQRVLHMPDAVSAVSAAAGRRPPVTAMLFQRPFLLHFSVQRNLQLALWLAGVPAAERNQRLHSALARVGLQAMAGRPARKTISSTTPPATPTATGSSSTASC